MKRLFQLAFLIVTILVVGCMRAEYNCPETYILIGDKCCLDLDNNNICDNDEKAPNVIVDDKPITCSKPYILVGTECCLDRDDNLICDRDETRVEKTDPEKQKQTDDQNSGEFSVQRIMPNQVSPRDSFAIRFEIANNVGERMFSLEDSFPEGFSLYSWQVTGSKESKDDVGTRAIDNRYAWSFTIVSSSATISYVVQAPSKPGTYTFDAIWFDASGQSRDTKSLTVG